MQGNRLFKKIFGTVFFAAVFLAASGGAVFGFALRTHAQTATQPQFLITWSASDSYAPQGYDGKILPNQESPITASLVVIANGKPANLSGQTISWYQSDAFLGGGVGAQSITFQPGGG